jgi:hypothetical protein
VAWIFQGNPKTFDVDDYVTRYPELIYWRTNRHAKEIAVGDRAVVWRSGSSAGAVAIGVVVEAPTPRNKVKHPEALGIDVRGAKESDPEGLQTGIHLEEVRLTSEEGFLPRMAVKRNPALAHATIITMSSGTVFPLSQSQTSAFERLWGLSVSSLLTLQNRHPRARENSMRITGESVRGRCETRSLHKSGHFMESVSVRFVALMKRQSIQLCLGQRFLKSITYYPCPKLHPLCEQHLKI